MRKPSYHIYVSKRKEHSFAHYDIRATKDSCLHDDVHDFLAKNDISNALINNLLDDHFFHARYTDPEYPM